MMAYKSLGGLHGNYIGYTVVVAQSGNENH